MEKFLTPQQVAESIGVKISTIYKWTHEKKIPRAGNCRLLRFRESEVMAWLLANQEAKEALPAAKKETKIKKRTGGMKSANVDRMVDHVKAVVR